MARAVIIGAGPAGSAAAISLLGGSATARFTVTIIESRAFPRSKVCGEFVSPAATEILESLIGPAALANAGAGRVDRLALELGDRTIEWPLPAPAWTLSRKSLDALMLDRARAAGASVIQPAAVIGVEYRTDGVETRLADGRTLPADLVIHADGSGRHDPAGPTACRRGVVGLKCFLRPPRPVRGIRMRAGRDGYLGMVGIEDGLATLALVMNTERLKAAAGDADAAVRALWPGFDPAWRVDDWLSCGVPGSAYRQPGHPRSFRIGNAAAAVEPVGGEGIGLALWSGVTLGRLLAAALHQDTAPEVDRLRQIERRLAAQYVRRLRWRRPSCRLAAAALTQPSLVRALWPALRAPAITIRPWYALTGKPLTSSARGRADALGPGTA